MFCGFTHNAASDRISFCSRVIFYFICITHFFILTIDRNLDWFHSLALVNTASINTRMKMCLTYFGSFGYVLNSGIAGSLYSSALKERLHCLLQRLNWFTSSPIVYENSYFSTSSFPFDTVPLFDSNCPNWNEMVSLILLWICISLMISDVECFSCTCWHLHIPF